MSRNINYIARHQGHLFLKIIKNQSMVIILFYYHVFVFFIIFRTQILLFSRSIVPSIFKVIVLALSGYHLPLFTVYSFSVPVLCRKDLARIKGLPGCGQVDLNRVRPPCELREPQDTKMLRSVASVSGTSEVCPTSLIMSCNLITVPLVRFQRHAGGDMVHGITQHYNTEDAFSKTNWDHLNIKCHLTSIGIPMLKIRRSRDRIIFNMEIPIPGRDGLYFETVSRPYYL